MNVFVSAIIGVAWYFDDSVYLRFVILFLGNMNAWYAIFDIYLDGFKYSGVQQSDATLMAKAFNKGSRNQVSCPTPHAPGCPDKHLTQHKHPTRCVTISI